MVATAAVSRIGQALDWPRRDASTLKPRRRTSPRKETHVLFSAGTGLNGNYLDEVWTLDNRAGGITIAQLNAGTGSHRLFYHTNTLYSVFALTDQTGAIVEGYMYDAYGRQSVDTSSGSDATWFTSDDAWTVGGNSAVGNPYMYTGQRMDAETGNMYYKNRYYASGLGRFLSRWGATESVQNLYEYQYGMPTELTDALGDPDPVGIFIDLVFLVKDWKEGAGCGSVAFDFGMLAIDVFAGGGGEAGHGGQLAVQGGISVIERQALTKTVLKTAGERTAEQIVGHGGIALAQSAADATSSSGSGSHPPGSGGSESGGKSGGHSEDPNKEIEGAGYESNPKHIGKNEPRSGADAIPGSLSTGISGFRVTIDGVTGEFIMLRQTSSIPRNVWHGFTSKWKGLPIRAQNALIKAGLVSQQGKIK